MATVCAIAAGIVLPVTGCSEKKDAAASTANAGGTVVISTAADADYLFPPLVATSQGKQVTESIFDHLVEVGDHLNVLGDQGFEPRLAERWQWANDSLSVAFFLNPKARWHDGKPVRASDVRFSYELYRNPAVASPLASLLHNIASVTVRDSTTAVIWLKKHTPTAFFDATMQLSIMPEHIYGAVPAATLKTSELIRNPVGSGRFRFARWVPATTIEIVADTANYRTRAKLNRVIWSISPDFTAAITKLLAGEADFFEAMRSENVSAAARDSMVKVKMIPSFDYGFLLFNLRDPKAHDRPHPLFGDRALRRALTMAIDEAAVTRNVFDSLAVPSIGPMTRAMPATDTTVTTIPYDVNGAIRTLDSLGWKDDGKGVRRKNGQPLAFTVTVPNVAATRIRCATVMQEQLKKVGVQMTLQPVEINTFLRMESAHTFDAVMQLWHLDASPTTIRQIWSTAAANDPHGNNFGGYTSVEFDARVDSATLAPTLEIAKPLFKRAYQTMIDDAPGIWLYEPKMVLGMHKRVRAERMRPDAWWANLADWWIPENERIARDNIPVDAKR